MPLAPGSRLGPYEILSAIGAGGMGEVYRAKDPRLGRDVAIKVLSQNLTASAEIRQRFEREARTISQLTHAHICAVYDVGREGDTEYLVMEYLEGETLATRLQKGPLPLEQTLRYGIEIAEALERAHRQGIVHRDLKPGNVMLTRSGVKLLDFGLAKAVAPQASNENVSSLPTEAPLTQEGSILGTFQYMAPEQIEGRAVDARSDIFSFGAVLYEMATGRRAFSGSTQASLISAIFRDEPQPISAVTPASPVALDRTIRTCLAKDPEERWQNAGDIRRELKWIAEGGSQPSAPAPAIPAPRRRTREPIAWAIAGLAVLGLIATTLIGSRRRPPASPTYRVAVLPPDGAVSIGPFALSPDGRRVVFSAIDGGGRQSLYLRSFDSLDAKALPGTEDGIDPFWSPDGASLGFFARQKLKRIEIAGGPARDLADVSDPRGGTWGRGGDIVFSPEPGSALKRISAGGGAVTAVTELDAKSKETSHRWPHFLPDGKHVLFLRRSPQGGESFVVDLVSLDSKQRRAVLDSLATAQYADGRLYYAVGTTLLSQAFDMKTLKVSGSATPFAEGVWLDRNVDGLTAFSVAPGVVAYRRGGFARSQFTWLDRTGRNLGPLGAPGPWGRPALSPDGRRVAFEGSEPGLNVSNIYLMDVATGTPTRFTFSTSNDSQAVWSPTGDRIAFDSDRAGPYDIYLKSVSGTAQPTPIVVSPNWKYVESWSADGRFLAYREVDPKTKGDLWILPMADGAKPSPYLQTPADERDAAFSPDGGFLAYSSDESGRNEVYVQNFPASGGKWQVSSAGGSSPHWRRDGREIYYVSSDGKIVAVPIEPLPGSLTTGIARPLFTVRLVRSTGGGLGYDVSADGERFLVDVSADEATTSPITLIIGSTTALAR